MISIRRRGGALLLGIATGSLLIGGVAIAAPATAVPAPLQALLGTSAPDPPTDASASSPSWRTAAPVAAALPTAAPTTTVAPPPPAPEVTTPPVPTPDSVPVRAVVKDDTEAPKHADEPDKARSDDDETRAPVPKSASGGVSGAVSGVAAAVVRETNEERRAAGCSDLTADPELTKAAQGHATDMADNNYFSHDSEDGTSFDQRIRAAGYSKPGGENIAMGQTSAEQVVQEWMDSPGHRRNILDCSFTTIGVGFDDNYWVQDFGR